MLVLLIYVGYIAIWGLLIFLASFISWKLFKLKTVTIIAGLVAFGVMYWPAFGDLIPTLWAHKQLCAKEAGFKVYVTPEQWAEENPGVLETLIPYEKYTAKNNIEFGNERIGMVFDIYPFEDFAVQKKVTKIIDVNTKKILLEDIDFVRGYGKLNNSLKFWLHSGSCYSNEYLNEKLLIQKEYLRKFNTIWSN